MYQLAALIDRIRAGSLRVLANAPRGSGGEAITLRAETAAEAYNITLGKDLVPSRIVYESAAGLGSGLQVLYSDYRAVGQGRYPATMAIRFPGQQGIQLRMVTLEANPKLQNKDFRP